MADADADADDRAVPGPAFARTYDPPAYEDAWEAVEDYQRTMDAAARYPQKKSGALARRVELPRGRIRPWVDGDAKPDAVRGLQRAEDRGWIDVPQSSAVFRGLNTLVAWVFSSGSISHRNYRPMFVVDGRAAEARLSKAFVQVGLSYQYTRRDESGRADEVVPDADASVLGRVLTVLGAPLGEKSERSAVSLPTYLATAPASVRRAFARTYVLNRGQVTPGKDTVKFREERPESYLSALRSLLRDVTGESVSVSERNVILSADAARALDVVAPLRAERRE